MTNYVTWVPEYDGHRPPYWQVGMRGEPAFDSWWLGVAYVVPPEALNPPFDAEAWLAQGHANADKLPDGVVLPDKLVVSWQTNSKLRLAEFLRKHCRPIGNVK